MFTYFSKAPFSDGPQYLKVVEIHWNRTEYVSKQGESEIPTKQKQALQTPQPRKDSFPAGWVFDRALFRGFKLYLKSSGR